MDQALMLRGSRDFESREAYAGFLRGVQTSLNRGRRMRFEEELALLRPLPAMRLEACKRLRVRVRSSSTVNVDRNVYSVESRLIGETVDVRLNAESVEVWYGQRQVHVIPRLRGRGKHRVNYRHVIDWLVRKPGAFEHYVYREELFPTSRFRMAFDWLREHSPGTAVAILRLAAFESETAVDGALRSLIVSGEPIAAEAVERLVRSQLKPEMPAEVVIDAVDLGVYDGLLEEVTVS